MNVIVDTGAIVALLDRRDRYHNWAKKKVAELDYPFYTCEAVLTESFYLLQGTATGQRSLLQLMEKELIQVNFSYSDSSSEVHRVMTSYSDLPASFADAFLVGMSEAIKNYSIFTLDDDFTIYRDSEGESLSLIIPE